MRVIDIVEDAAQLLGLHEEVEVLTSATQDNEAEVLKNNEKIASLFHLIQYSIRELCTNYIPVIQTKIVTTEDKKYPISGLENFIRVKEILKNQEVIKYKTINRNLIFEEDGNYEVVYAMYPTILSLFEEMDFLSEFSPDVIVMGLCAYFSIAHGMFDEFADFHDRYITKAESLKSLRNFDLPCRRWE